MSVQGNNELKLNNREELKNILYFFRNQSQRRLRANQEELNIIDTKLKEYEK